MASDSFPQEADARTKPDPEDGSSPSTEPALPTVAISASALEPPTPEAFAPSSAALGSTVVRPRLREPIRVQIVTAPQTSEARAGRRALYAHTTCAFVLRLGEFLAALTGTILSLTWHFTFGWIEVVLLGEIMAFVLFSLVLRIPGRPSLSGWVAFVRGLRPHPRPFEWLALGGIASIAALVFYQATPERIIETDSLIY